MPDSMKTNIDKLIIYCFCVFRVFIYKVFKGNKKSKNSHVNKIVVVSVHHLGEDAMFWPFFRSLMERCKREGIELYFASNYASVELYKYLSGDGIEGYYIIDKDYGLCDDPDRERFCFSNYLCLCKDIQDLRPDTVIVPYRSKLATFIMAAIKADHKYYMNHLSQYYSPNILLKFIMDNMADALVLIKEEQHLLLDYSYFMGKIGIPCMEMRVSRLGYQKDSNNINSWLSKIGLRGRYCIVVPGAQETSRRWNVENFGAIVSYIISNSDLKVLIVGNSDEMKIGKELKDAFAENDKVKDMTGKTQINELCGLVENAEFVFGNDTGTIHIAAALGVKAICVIGYQAYGRYQPYCNIPGCLVYENLPEAIWAKEKPYCSRCELRIIGKGESIHFDFDCDQKIKNGGTMNCIDSISVEQVTKVIAKYI